jgi:hypothetical protein
MSGNRRTPVEKAIDPAKRAHALDLAEKVGDIAAAGEIGCSPATIRSWRFRAKAASSTPWGDAAQRDNRAEDGDRAADLQREADEAGDAARRNVTRSEQAAEKGEARAAREYSQTARDHEQRRHALAAEARAAREHELRLRQAEHAIALADAELFLRLARMFFESVGVGWQPAHEALLEALLAAFVDGWRDDDGKLQIKTPTAEVEAARDAIDAVFRRRYIGRSHKQPLDEIDRDDHADEIAPADDAYDESAVVQPIRADYGETTISSGAPPLDPDVAVAEQDATPAPDDLPPWDSLPEDWRRRYALQPTLGRYEFKNELRRRERDRQEAQAARPRRAPAAPTFRHPGWTHPGEGRSL